MPLESLRNTTIRVSDYAFGFSKKPGGYEIFLNVKNKPGEYRYFRLKPEFRIPPEVGKELLQRPPLDIRFKGGYISSISLSQSK